MTRPGACLTKRATTGQPASDPTCIESARSCAARTGSHDESGWMSRPERLRKVRPSDGADATGCSMLSSPPAPSSMIARASSDAAVAMRIWLTLSNPNRVAATPAFSRASITSEARRKGSTKRGIAWNLGS